jgi:hypothetical protein
MSTIVKDCEMLFSPIGKDLYFMRYRAEENYEVIIC